MLFIGLFCRILSLLHGSFAKETYPAEMLWCKSGNDATHFHRSRSLFLCLSLSLSLSFFFSLCLSLSLSLVMQIRERCDAFYRSLLQHIISVTWLFCKRDLPWRNAVIQIRERCDAFSTTVLRWACVIDERVYIYVHVCRYICINTFLWLYVHWIRIYDCVNTYIWLYVHSCRYVCMNMYLWLYEYVYMIVRSFIIRMYDYTFIHVGIYVWIRIYDYTFIQYVYKIMWIRIYDYTFVQYVYMIVRSFM